MQIFAQKLVPQSRVAVTISRSSSVDYPSSDRGPGKHLQRTNRRQRCWSNSCHQMFVLNRLLKLWLYCRNIWMKCWTIPAFKSTSNYWDYAASFHRSHKRSFRFNVSIIETKTGLCGKQLTKNTTSIHQVRRYILHMPGLHFKMRWQSLEPACRSVRFMNSGQQRSQGFVRLKLTYDRRKWHRAAWIFLGW